eukprot:gene6325-7579_t
MGTPPLPEGLAALLETPGAVSVLSEAVVEPEGHGGDAQDVGGGGRCEEGGAVENDDGGEERGDLKAWTAQKPLRVWGGAFEDHGGADVRGQPKQDSILPEACEAPVVEGGEGGEHALLTPSALEAYLRGASSSNTHMVTRQAVDRDLSAEELRVLDRVLLRPEQVVYDRAQAFLGVGEWADHPIEEGAVQAAFNAGLVGDEGVLLAPPPLREAMFEESVQHAKRLGVAEAATALPAEAA